MHIGYSFLFLGHWQAAIALPLAGTERDATPLMADKTPLFWQGIERGGEQVFWLCLHGERIKLCGHDAGWHGELVCNVFMSVPAPMVQRICAAPVAPKEAPELITPTVLDWENCTFCTIPSLLTAEEGQFKDIFTVRLQICLWKKPSLTSHLDPNVFLSVHKCRATVTELGDERN